MFQIEPGDDGLMQRIKRQEVGAIEELNRSFSPKVAIIILRLNHAWMPGYLLDAEVQHAMGIVEDIIIAADEQELATLSLERLVDQVAALQALRIWRRFNGRR